MYSEDKPFKVYCGECFYGDGWDPTKYGRPFDFQRPFFDQFKELMMEVPHVGNVVLNSTNCEYNNYIVNSKDCYLSTRTDGERIFYSYLTIKGLACIDCLNTYQCQYCYECVDCWNCYESAFCQNCRDTSNSWFCYDCIGCSNCFGCVELRNAQYHIFNQKYSKEQYKEIMKEWNTGSYEAIQKAQKKFQEEILKHPLRANMILHSSNATGDYISDSKDIHESFDIEKTDTSRNSWGVEYSRDIYDSDFIYYGENCYENISNSKSSNIYFSFGIWMGAYDLSYCILCVNNTNNCFGSISLKQKKFCILNKQYEPKEYKKMLAKIKDHMRKTREYGEFFPPSLSFFGYNESVAQDFFPLTKDEALARNFNWYEEKTPLNEKHNRILLDDIRDVTDEILKEILNCHQCGRSYQIIAQELKIYRLAHIPLPRKCPNCRHLDRMKQRNPRKLFVRTCTKCHTEIQSTYASDRPEKIYCEKCYLEAIY